MRIFFIVFCLLPLYNCLRVQKSQVQSGFVVQDNSAVHNEVKEPGKEMKENKASCCEALTVYSPGLTLEMQWTRLGRYILTGTSQGGKPVYTQDNMENFLYYMPDLSLWYIGDKLGVNMAGILNFGDETCPTENTEVWEVYAWKDGYDDWTPDPELRVTCEGDSPPTNASSSSSITSTETSREACTWGSFCDGCSIWSSVNDVKYCCANNCNSGGIYVEPDSNGNIDCYCYH